MTRLRALPASRLRPIPVVVTYMPIREAALDHLGVTGDDLDLGSLGRSGDRLDLAPQDLRLEALLEHQRKADRDRQRAGGGEVVHRAVDGELADRAAGEAQWLDHVGVGGQGQAKTLDRDRACVGELVERLGGECRGEQALDQRLGRLASGAVGHRDPLVLEPRALRARRLDDLEDPLLLGRGAWVLAGALTRPLLPGRGRGRSGRSCSRRRRRPPGRPCRCRSRARAYKRCRTPCTPRA